MSFNLKTETEGVQLLVMANKYLFKDLELDIAKQLKNILTPQNFSTIYSAACMCSVQSLKEECLKFADSKCNEILKSSGFANLQVDAIGEIVSRPTFKPEHTVFFNAVAKWIEVNGRECAGPILSKIRLPDLPLEFLVKTVRASGLFSDSEIVDAINAMENLSAWSNQNNTMQISVHTECQRGYSCGYKSHMTLEVKSNETVAAVKERIMARRTCCSGSAYNIRLTYGGTGILLLLEDHRTLKECKIKSGSAVIVAHS